jgi:homoserine/homoserine lactone efflux protein
MSLLAFITFAVPTFFILLSPGPTAILLTSQGAASGARKTFMAVLGIMATTVVYFILSAIGLAALIVASETLFQIIKWAGIGYLFYLGLSALLSKSGGLSVDKSAKPKSATKLFLLGFAIEMSNPKAVLYYGSLLPQFIDLGRPLLPQFAIMCLATLAMQLPIYAGYALVGDRIVKGGIKPVVAAWLNRIAGGALILAGIKMASVSAKN